MYGKPGAKDDWAAELKRYHKEQREARNARFVVGTLAVAVVFFLPYIVAGWPV